MIRVVPIRLISVGLAFLFAAPTAIRGANLSQLTFGSNLDWDVSPSWSADGDRIAFGHYFLESPIHILHGEIRGLHLSDGAHLLFPGQSFGINQDPTWSPDGRVGYHDSSGRLWITDPSGTTALQLTDGFMDLQPAWSPSGDRIAFKSDRSGNDDIWIVNAGGGIPTKVTDDPAADTRPSWSPDGTRIVFLSERSENPDLWIVGANGGEVQQITFGPRREDSPAWSPDGKWIAFVAEEDLWVMPAQGGDAIQITTGAGANEPAWSPDSSKLAFFSSLSGQLRIWIASELGVMAVETSTWTRIKALYRPK